MQYYTGDKLNIELTFYVTYDGINAGFVAQIEVAVGFGGDGR